MFKRFFTVVLCVIMLLFMVACGDSTENSKLNDPVFNTDNIVRITLYGYYGGGKGCEVSSEHMTEIMGWLGSFTISEKAPDLIPPGTNTYYVEIEYSDGTVIKEGLDLIVLDGTSYYIKGDKTPDCFEEIISKSSLK